MNHIAPMYDRSIERVREIEAAGRSKPQTPVTTKHVLHAGLYARTVYIPPMNLMVGALIKRATVLIVSGQAYVFFADRVEDVHGYQVFAASSPRKTMFMTRDGAHITMLFPTNAKTIEEAEAEFTDDIELLASHSNHNEVLITGE